MNAVSLFDNVVGFGTYVVGYLVDGWTKELTITASKPIEAMLAVQNKIGGICNVTYVERW